MIIWVYETNQILIGIYMIRHFQLLDATLGHRHIPMRKNSRFLISGDKGLRKKYTIHLDWGVAYTWLLLSIWKNQSFEVQRLELVEKLFTRRVYRIFFRVAIIRLDEKRPEGKRRWVDMLARTFVVRIDYYLISP